MRSRMLLWIALAIGPTVAAGAQPVEAEEPTATADAEEIVEESAEEALQRLTGPGEHHQHLDRLAGDWELTIRLWPSPDAEPVEAAGTAEARWILGGRFLWTIYRAQLFGQPFEAWAIDGYDNQAGQYVGTWRDTQGTYTLVYRGKCQPAKPPEEGEEPPPTEEERPEGLFRTMRSKVTDPVSEEEFDVRTEITVQEDGRGFVQESFVVLSPEESVKNLEITGRRRDE